MQMINWKGLSENAVSSLFPAQPYLVSFEAFMIVEVSLQAGVQNIVAMHPPSKSSFTPRYISVAHCARSLPRVPLDMGLDRYRMDAAKWAWSLYHNYMYVCACMCMSSAARPNFCVYTYNGHGIFS